MISDDSTVTSSLDWRDPEVLARANIMPATGLATDYLNVFNEAVMLFGLLPDMPDMIDELLAWQPVTYQQHFQRSGFQAKELAILAYQNCDPALKASFDDLSTLIGDMIAGAIVAAAGMLENKVPLALFVTETNLGLQSAIMLLDSMVHGGTAGSVQNDIDALFD